MGLPTVSVVIPVYNGARYLAEAIESVLAQTISTWELVIVDDGSADGTPGVAESYAARDARIRVVRQANGGVAAARNRGLQETDPSSGYVIFLDHDDVWERDALETLLATLADCTECVGAHGLCREIDTAGNVVKDSWFERFQRDRRRIVGMVPVPWKAPRPTTFAVLAYRNSIVTPGQLLMRRRALAAAGRFDTTLVLAQDWDMWLRLTARGDIAFVNKVVLQYRVHGGNRSLQYRAMHRAMVRIYRTYSASRGLSKEQRHAMRAGYCWHHWFTSQSHWGWARECAAQGEWREAILHALSVQAGLTRFCLSFARLWIAMQPHKPRHRL